MAWTSSWIDHRRVGLDGLAAIDRHVHPDAAEVHAFGVGRVDAEFREVHGAWVRAVRLAPGRARVIRAPEAREARVRRFAGGGLDERVDDRRVAARDVHRDAAEGAGGISTADLGPVLAAIDGLVERRAGPAAIHAAGGAAALVERGEEDLRVRQRHRDVVGAGVLIAAEHEAPGLAAVDGLVDAAFAAGAEERAGGGDEDDVVVGGVDQHLADVHRRTEAHVREGLAAIGRLIDAFAPTGGLPVVRLTGADPDEVRVGLRDRDRADGEEALVLEQRRVERAVGRGLPDAAVGGAHVVDGGVRLIDREARDAARHRGGADRAEVQGVELGRHGELVLRRGTGRGEGAEEERGDEGAVGQGSHDGSPHTGVGCCGG